MPFLGPETCSTLLAFLLALGTPSERGEALAWAREEAGEATGRYAMTLANAVERDCKVCIEEFRARCEPPAIDRGQAHGVR